MIKAPNLPSPANRFQTNPAVKGVLRFSDLEPASFFDKAEPNFKRSTSFLEFKGMDLNPYPAFPENEYKNEFTQLMHSRI